MKTVALLLLPLLIVSCGDEPENTGPKTGDVDNGKKDDGGIKDVDLGKKNVEAPKTTGGSTEKAPERHFGEAGKSTSSSEFYVCPKSGCKYGSSIEGDTCLTHSDTKCVAGAFECGSCGKKAGAAGKCCGADRVKKMN